MLIGTGIHLVSNKDNITTYFVIGTLVSIKKRNYNSKNGYELINGKIVDIYSATNEIVVDVSEENESKHIIIGFGEILDIEMQDDEDEIKEITNEDILIELLNLANIIKTAWNVEENEDEFTMNTSEEILEEIKKLSPKETVINGDSDVDDEF